MEEKTILRLVLSEGKKAGQHMLNRAFEEVKICSSKIEYYKFLAKKFDVNTTVDINQVYKKGFQSVYKKHHIAN